MNHVNVMQQNSELEYSPRVSQFRAVLLNWVIGLCALVVPAVQAGADIIQNGDVFISVFGQTVAENANGDLEVNGGSVLVTDGLILATRPTVVGNVLVTDPGSAILLTGPFNRLGIERGTGSITVQNGAVIDGTAPGCPPTTCNVFIGNGAGSIADLTISGTGSTITVVNFTGIGGAAVFTLANDGFDFGIPGGSTTAFVQIRDGGTLNTEQSVISAGPGGGSPTGTESTDATVIVTGLGSAWNVDGGLSIAAGPNSIGRLAIQQGGHLFVRDFLVVGASTDGFGQLSVTDATVHIGNIFNIGAGANGSGMVRVSGGQIDALPGGTDPWLIGFFGAATLTISKAGTVVQDSSRDIIVALDQNSTATVRVSGAGSILDAGATLALGIDPADLGVGGDCTVIIGKGALIRATQILLGPGCSVKGKGTLQGSVMNLGGSIGSKVNVIP